MRPVITASGLAVLLLAAWPAAAQFKVVGPDGRVTYTDRPPGGSAGTVSPLRADPRAAADASGGPASLPADLRRVAARYPVVLYAATECDPCDKARQLLQARGIPFSERRVGSADDAAALARLTGDRMVPSLTVGNQALNGLAEADWQAYLDAAGYPRESRLPRSYVAPEPQPLTERRASARPAARPAAPIAAAEPAASAPADGLPPPPPPGPGTAGIRF